MTTLSTYQNLIEKVGLSKLDEANKDTYNIVREGSSNFSDPNLWNEMLADADIQDAYELHVKALQKMASGVAPKPSATSKMKRVTMFRKKAAAAKAKEAKPSKKPKPKKVAPKKARKVRAAPKKVAKVSKPEMKFPITVKRFSKELQLIKRFASLDGKQKTVSALQSFHKSLARTLKDQPDRKPLLSEMFSRLKDALGKAETNRLTHINVNLEKTFKEKLVKSVKEAKPKVKLEYLAGLPQKKSPIVTVPGENDLSAEASAKEDGLFQNINHIDRHTKDTFQLKGALGVFLGDLEMYKLAMSIEGDQGAGKTQLAFQLADGFADIGYEVGMFQLEIGANSNIIRKNRDKYIRPANRSRLQIAGEAPNGIDTVRQYAQKFRVIIIDSWTKLDVDSLEFDRLRNDFPDTIWIVLFQRTSANKIRGGTKPLYDAGINIEVVKADETFINNYAVATKNRYGQTGIRYNVSSKKIENHVQE
jgi:hypothetical protein